MDKGRTGVWKARRLCTLPQRPRRPPLRRLQPHLPRRLQLLLARRLQLLRPRRPLHRLQRLPLRIQVAPTSAPCPHSLCPPRTSGVRTARPCHRIFGTLQKVRELDSEPRPLGTGSRFDAFIRRRPTLPVSVAAGLRQRGVCRHRDALLERPRQAMTS